MRNSHSTAAAKAAMTVSPQVVLKTTFLLFVGFLAIAALPAAVEARLPLFQGKAKTPHMPIGTNLPPILPGINTYCPWKNIMLCSSEYVVKSSTWRYVNNNALEWTADGYPKGLDQRYLAFSIVHTNLGAGGYLTGSYQLSFTGNGTVSLGGDVTSFPSTTTSPLTFVVPAATPIGIWVTINVSSTTDPVTNIAIVHSSYLSNPSSDPLDMTWKGLLTSFTTLRTAHWQRELYSGYSNPPPLEWSARAKTSYSTFATSKGVPHEITAAIAKQLSKNLWLSIPQLASESYISSMAAYYRDNTPATAVLYVEDSFRNGFSDDPIRRVNRLKQIHRIFAAVFGSATSARVKIVVTVDLLTDRFDKYLDANRTGYDAEFRRIVHAIAPKGASVSGSTPWSEINPNPFLLKYLPYLNDTRRIIQERMWDHEIEHFKYIARMALLDIPVFAYEGGIFLSVGHYGYRYHNPNTTQADIEGILEQQFWKMERDDDTDLKNLWAEWLERWYRMGGGMFMAGQLLTPGVQCHTHNTKIDGANRWQCNYPGLVRFASKPQTNKLKGLFAFMNKDPVVASLLLNTPLPTPPTCNPACVWGNCVNGICHCHHGYQGTNCSVFNSTLVPNFCNPDDYGVNLGGMSDWTPSWMWSDWMKFARLWVFQPVSQPNTEKYGWIWAYGSTEGSYRNVTDFPTLDANGYPISLAPNDAVCTFLRRDTYEYPHGIYHFYYDGDGTFTFGMDTHLVRRVRQGHYILESKPVKQLNNGLFFKIVRTNPDDHVRNIRVVHQSQIETFQSVPFHPLFLRSLQEYKYIRFMGMQRVGGEGEGAGSCTHLRCPNLNTTDSVRSWTDRTVFTYYSQRAGRDGVSIEYIVQLCNMLHINPWINIPFNADDTYVRMQARYVKKHLNPRLKPVIEYSNEVWASHHYVGYYAQDKGVQNFPSTSNDAVKARACWNQKRGRQIWAVYNAEGVAVTRVLGGQAVYTRVIEEALKCEANVHASVDMIAIAPYFGADLVGPDGIRPMDDVFADVGLALNESIEDVKHHLAIANKYNLKVALYEAGPSFFGGALASAPEVQELGLRVHRDPRIETLVARYFQEMRKAGSSLHMYFLGPAAPYSTYGAWGIREYQNQDPATAYKLLGYQAYAAVHQVCNATRLPQPSCPSNCNGKGFCMADGKCECYMGFRGASCETPFRIVDTRYCNRYTCAERNGTCTSKGMDGHYFEVYMCTGCLPGWNGWDCNTPSCPSNCSYAGTCVAPNKCKCYRGHTGDVCQTNCGCNGLGSCTPDGRNCTCDAGYVHDAGRCVARCACSICLAPNICGCSEKCVFGSCWDGKCQCWSGFDGPTCANKSAALSKNNASVMGINIAGIADWTSTLDFINLMFRSREWFLNPARVHAPSSLWTVNEPLTLTRDGYPAFLPFDRVAGTFATRDTRSYIPAGKYILLYDGNGRVEVGMDAKVIEETRSKGRMEVQYTPTSVRDNGFYIRIEATDPKSPVRNIRILPPDYPYEAYAQNFVFHPKYLQDLENFRTLRFMGWVGLGKEYPHGPLMNTRYWKDRKLPTDASMATGYGVSENHMICLCNLLNAEPWFTIPHDASDEYVQKFAEFIKYKLRPDVAIHIEHSNEVWNGNFQSYKYAKEKGHLLFPNESSRDVPALYHGYRSQQIFNIFKAVFGPKQFSRLQFKLGTFLLSTYITKLSLRHATQRPLSISVTTYFCGEGTYGGAGRAMQLTTAQLVDECSNYTNTVSNFKYHARNVALAREYGLGIDAYESGPSLVQYATLFGTYARPGIKELYHSMHMHIDMATIVGKYFTIFHDLGIELQNYFTSPSRSSVYGSWGIKESTASKCDNSQPKCKGTMNWIDAHRNTTIRTITWGMSDYGINNVVAITFDKDLTTAEREAVVAKLEQESKLVAGSLAVMSQNQVEGSSQTLAAPTATSTVARREFEELQTTATPSSTYYFVVSVTQSTASETFTSAAQTVASKAAASAAAGGDLLGTGAFKIIASSVDEPQTEISPNIDAPTATDAPIAGVTPAPDYYTVTGMGAARTTASMLPLVITMLAIGILLVSF